MEAEEMKSPFEAIKQTDEVGKEWWNSRQLAKVMGYTKYWNFERLMDKVAHALQVERGLERNGHFREIEEMAQLGKRHSTTCDKRLALTCSMYGHRLQCRPAQADGEDGTGLFSGGIDGQGTCQRGGRQCTHLPFIHRQGECVCTV